MSRQQFTVDAPLRTHWVKATCAEVRCLRYEIGFHIALDVTDYSLHANGLSSGKCTRPGKCHPCSALWLRSQRELTFKEVQNVEGLTEFHFPPGQECFEGKRGMHRRKLDRLEIHTQTTRSGTYQFDKPEHWNECFADEMYQVERALSR